MTAQLRDIINIDGQEYGMSTEPLKPFLSGLSIELRRSNCSMCWRGYQAVWELKNDQLFLSGLEPVLGGDERFSLDYLFAKQKNILADWFSGDIKVPQGELMQYVHGGYASVHERTLILHFDEGCLIGSDLIENEVGESIHEKAAEFADSLTKPFWKELLALFKW